MSIQIRSWAASIFVSIQIAVANLDSDVLQWPGGSLFASVLWMYELARALLVIRPAVVAGLCPGWRPTYNLSLCKS